MTRVLAPYLIGAFAFAVVIAWAINWFVQVDRDRRELQGARDHIEGTQDADEAVDDVRRTGARDWLCNTFRGACDGDTGPGARAD